MERCGIPVEEANYGVSVYFACRTVGAFIGAFILSKYSATKFFRISMIVAVAALIGMLFVTDKPLILTLVGVIGFSCANVFSILFSIALQRAPEKANEISGLMITGISGGALIPIFMGLATDLWGNQSGSVFIICICAAYLLICAFYLKKDYLKKD
jgi:fucose permease